MKRKWLERFKAGAAVLFALTLTVSGPLQSLAVQAADDETSAEAVTVDVYPKPQEIVYISEEGMKLEGTVNIVVHGEQDEATLPQLEELLKSQGIAYQMSDEIVADKATIFITSDKDHCSDCGGDALSDNAALNEVQGYLLEASNNVNSKGFVGIYGADEDGAYYGVMTLKQMLEQKTEDGLFAEVSITDYPDIKMRGFVEGFYGYPWSTEDRISLMRESSKFKMNTYIYAPKDDPYHNASWRTLYPEAEAAGIRQLVEAADEVNVNFCWAIHPGEGFNYSTDTDYNSLIAKFEQMYGLGVRQFGILYDDIGSSISGTNQANLINRVNEEFVQAKGDVKPIIVVGTRYCAAWGPDMSTYFTPFYSTLDEDVIVMWTGAGTMSDVSKAIYDWPKQQSGVDRDLASWWNYPVNDYCDGNLMMAPLEPLHNDVDNLSGFFLNPMSQADASKVAIFSGADYSWNVADFDTTGSWKRAIKELVPEANEEFERFADNLSYINDGFVFDESRYLKDEIAAFNDAVSSGTGISEAAAVLKTEFEMMISDVDALKKLNNTALQEEINPFLNAYEALAKAGAAAMEAFISAQKGDIATTLDNINILNEKLAETETYKVTSLESSSTQENVVKVGELRIKPLLKVAEPKIQSLLKAAINPEVECQVFTDEGEVADKEVVLSGVDYTVSDLQLTLGKGGYVGYNLPRALKLSEISVETAQTASLEIQYSLNGIEWETAEATVEEGVLKVSTPVAAAYVRAVNKEDEEIEVNITKFKATMVYSLGTVSATTNLGTYQYYSISRAVDGNMSTQYYSDSAPAAGSNVQVDLGKTIPLYDLKICYGVNPKGVSYGVDGFASTKVELSLDGVSWEQLGDVIEDDNYVAETISGQSVASVSYNAEGKSTRYIRITNMESNAENWVQIFEVLYNETAPDAGDDTVILAESSFETTDISNLYDGDITTSVTVRNITNGDYLTYKMTTITDVGALTIVQDRESICGAKVSVKDVDGNWTDIGSLDEQISILAVNKTITEVKLSFDEEKPVPVLYEIFVAGEVKVDKTDLDNLIAEVEGMELSKYTDESVEALNKVLANSKDVYNNQDAAQDEVDKAIEDLHAAVNGLEEKTVDPEPVDPTRPGIPYTDVNEGDWFYEYVYDVYEKELMTGLEKTIFGPNQKLARAQFALILYRMEGQPAVDFTNPFPDVPDDSWYTDAVLWAVKAGVVTGYTGSGKFGPSDDITREQMATMMYRYAKYKNLDVSEEKSLNTFPDGSKVQEFAVDGMEWCVAKGIISGKGEEPKVLDPQGSTIRAECATIISRFVKIAE